MTIETEHVLFAHNTTTEPTDRLALHCHPLYECYYILSGDVHYLVEGVPYRPAPRSLLLMAGGVFHGVRIATDAAYDRYTLHLDPACLPEAARARLLAPFHAGSIYHPAIDRYRLDDFFRALEDCAAMPPDLREIAMPLRVAALLTQVCALHDAQRAAPPDGGIALDRQIVAYINIHLTEPLPLERIARHFFISRNQLCRVFARATGTTVAAYIRQKRLLLAGQLRANGQSAGEAAANAGFGDYSTYYRASRRQAGEGQGDQAITTTNRTRR